jgi:hypothetical protein
MITKSVSDRDQRRGGERLSDVCNYLLQTYTRGPSWIDADSEKAFDLLFNLAKSIQMERLVPVYRQHQPTQWSRCMLAGAMGVEACEVCAPHRECAQPGKACRDCFRGRKPRCPLAEPATPAFTVTKNAAIRMVRLQMASFVNGSTAIRLTFAKAIELRGGSVRIDEAFLLAYATGKRFAVEVIEGQNGWAESSSAKVFTTKWPVIYGEACCAWPPSQRVPA